MDKYYTPEIKEFHIGFEYEYEDINESGSTTSWYKTVVKENECYIIDQHLKYSDDLNLRVKYLSREDVESLGWKVFSDYGASTEFKFEDRYKLVKVKHEGLTYSKNEIRIFENTSIFGEDYTSRLFIGTIKNKSELIKLLKQLGIE